MDVQFTITYGIDTRESYEQALEWPATHGYVVALTLDDGAQLDPVQLEGFDRDYGERRLLCKHYDEAEGVAIGDQFAVDFDSIVKVHIF